MLAFKRGGRVAGDWCGSCQGDGVRAAGNWRADRKRGGGGLYMLTASRFSPKRSPERTFILDPSLEMLFL